MEESSSDIHIRLVNLLEEAGPSDIHAVYQASQPLYLELNAEQIFDEIEDLFLKAPSGRLVENQRAKMEKCVCDFLLKMESHLDNIDSDELKFQMLKWMLVVLSDLADNFLSRQPNRTMKASELTNVLTALESVRSMVQLLSIVLKELLEKDPTSVMDSLLEALKFGVSFDWVLLHITKSFPFQLIPQLLKIGVAEAAQSLDDFEETPSGTDAGFSVHFVVISDLLLFLSSMKTPNLKACLLDQVETIFNDPAALSNFLFIARLMLTHADIYAVIGQDVERFVNTTNLIRVVQLTRSHIWKLAKPPGVNLKLSLQAIVKVTSLNALVKLYETLIPFVSDKGYVAEKVGGEGDDLDDTVKLFADFQNDVFSTFYFEICYNNTFSVSGVPRLNEIYNEREVSEYYCKLLGMVAMKTEKEYSATLLSELLLGVEDESQLIQVCKFNRILSTHHPQVLTEALDQLFVHMNSIPLSNIHHLRTITTLARWQSKASKQLEGMCSVGVAFGQLDDRLQVVVINQLLTQVNALRDSAVTAEDFATYMTEWASLANYLKPIDVKRFSANQLDDLIESLAALSVSLLKELPGKLEELKCSELMYTFLDFVKFFIIPEQIINEMAENYGNPKERTDQDQGDVAVKELETEFYSEVKELVAFYLKRFIQRFLTNVFDASFELFGTIKGDFETTERLAYIDISDTFLPEHCRTNKNPKEATLLEKLRAKTMETKRTTELAHSGRISSVHVKKKAGSWTMVEELRKGIILDFVRQFCLVEDFRDVEQDTSKQLHITLAQTLCDLVAPDSLVRWVGWCEWTAEKDMVPLFNEVVKKVEQMPLIQDLLVYLAEAGPLPLINCIPLVKAQLAVAINAHGATPRRRDPLTNAELERLARVFSVLFISGLLNTKYRSIYDICKAVGQFNTHSVLVAVWEVIRTAIPKNEVVLKAVNAGEKTLDEVTEVPNEMAMLRVVVPIASHNIMDTAPLLGQLLRTVPEMEEEPW